MISIKARTIIPVIYFACFLAKYPTPVNGDQVPELNKLNLNIKWVLEFLITNFIYFLFFQPELFLSQNILIYLFNYVLFRKSSPITRCTNGNTVWSTIRPSILAAHGKIANLDLTVFRQFFCSCSFPSDIFKS